MRVGMLGFGTVGSATVESLVSNGDRIRAHMTRDVEIVHVATRTPARVDGRVPSGCVVSDDTWGLVRDPSIDVVIEVTGAVDSARDLVLSALANGKHVVTANKALLARHGAEIFTFADAQGRLVMFEGAVAVAVPIVKVMKEAFAANSISSIAGILNGTSNYVLSRMHDGADLDSALRDAQRNGFAEADSTLDMSGEDTAHKLTLLASIGLGAPVDLDRVRYSGVEAVDARDLIRVAHFGFRLKLIGLAERAGSELNLRVEPMLVPEGSLLSMVEGAMNGVLVEGDLLGRSFLYGAGAGGRETASAILADLVTVSHRLAGGGGDRQRAHNLGLGSTGYVEAPRDDASDASSRFYARIRVSSESDVEVARAELGDLGVTESFRTEAADHGASVDVYGLTDRIARADLDATLRASVLDGVRESVAYPILE
jgi:homoserine dehydrogenase